ncbi:efflux RND transporter periplasmic adaptor subunit [Facilibium subflavum]|uniref:efflux RND transporter periplasmic adaptor subunit n=1 Tax=Facilibium subflavum TaxID=2219058 RepID=UPI000E65BA06|nr:HlyD family efflux transporter periplasmic adaptor subunit [Facilibium subflavum]
MTDVLVSLLAMQQELRGIKKLDELAFFITHQTRTIVPYDRSVSWSCYGAKYIHVRSISGVTQLNKHSNYQLKCNQFLSALLLQYPNPDASKSIAVNYDDAPGALQDNWVPNLGKHVLCKFFTNKYNQIIGGMLIARDAEILESEINRFDWISDAYADAWLQLSRPVTFWGKVRYYFTLKKTIIWSIVIILLALMFIRVPQSVIAPASIVPKDPYIVTVPMDGVIENIVVKPEQKVKQGALLFTMDKRDLLNSNELAKRQLATALAKYKTAMQASFDEVDKRAEINVLLAEVREKRLEVDYTNHLLQESDVTTPVSGVVVLDEPSRWIGKPVSTGENVMQIAYPDNIEIEIWLPVSDAINFKPGDEVKLFLNADPLNPIYGKIVYSSFEASITASQVLAYQVIASIDPKQLHARIGSQGVAKIIGERVSLFYYLFRKPITTLRQFFGW